MSSGVTLADLSAVRLALMAEGVRAQSAPVLRADPIAIVGMACRTPGGVEDSKALWDLLATGTTTARDVPADRFNAGMWYDPDPAVPGKSVTSKGSFLNRIDLFDADYFGILAREADQMDPQQRLALEAAIEAIDDAGIPHAALRGSRSAVFMACYHSDYARLAYQNINTLDTRTLTGTVHCIVSNRISHFLDLRGPSLTLDTGCSSSLVAIHLACQSLRLGESDFALAGGVSVMITPELFVAMTKVGFMAADGACKTFDASADGFGRGEGCGVVALKRLSDAVADGDRVLAVIRGSAVNQDGRSTVLTAPNGRAQEALIRDALEVSGVAPERIGFVEAHGTGTSLGDPIEIEALGAVLGGNGSEAGECYVGSAKANIGHLEAAAGVVGLIKTVETLRRGQIPPQPNFENLSPHISLERTRLAIPASLTPFPAVKAPRCAAVSSFGIGGTNGHVIVEEAPILPRSDPAPMGAIWTLPLSAKTSEGLADLARTWLDLLDDPKGASIEDLCHTASRRRSHYPVRIAVVGKDKRELRNRLALALDQLPVAAPTVKPRIGFVFSGQGTQWFAMGRELLATEPVFRSAMEACDTAIRRVSGWSVIEELARPEEHSRVGETSIAQPALFALQTALVALWSSWGIRPAAVTGHSVGEIAALCASGVLSIDEAARIVVKRGEIMQAATGLGRMAAVPLTEAEAQALVAEFGGGLDVGAVNAPRSTVLSGEVSALELALAALSAKGVSARPLQVDYAFHSSQMNALAAQFASELGPVRRDPAQIPIYSTLTGAALGSGAVDAAYFADAIRRPVRFSDAVSAMSRDNIEVFVEIGPHPALAAAIAETLEQKPARVVVPSLRRGRHENDTIHSAMAALYAAGVDPDWSAVQPAEGEVTSLPIYPWRRRRFWIANERARAPIATETDWIGPPVAVAGTALTIVPLHPQAIGDWVGDHRIFGDVILPGAAILQAMSAAASAVSQGQAPVLEGLVIHEPLKIGGEDERWQIVCSMDSDGWTLAFHAQQNASASWRLIAKGRAIHEVGRRLSPSFVGLNDVDIQSFYNGLSAAGIGFGPAFRVLTRAETGLDQAQGLAVLPGGIDAPRLPHPILLDAAFQVAQIAGDISTSAYLPLSVDRASLSSWRGKTLHLHARIVSRSEASLAADVVGYDESGSLVVELEGVQFVKVAADRFDHLRDAAESYTIDWFPAPKVATDIAANWVVLEDDAGVIAPSFAAALEENGSRVLRARPAHGQIAQFIKEIPGEFAGAAIACLWPLDAANPPDAGYDRLLDLIHALAAAGPRTLLFVSKGATASSAICVDEHGAMQGAGFSALAVVAALEHPELSVRVLDIDSLDGVTHRGATILGALRASDVQLLALRGDEVLSPRMRRITAGVQHTPIQVLQTGAGLDGVETRRFEVKRPDHGELLVRVRASGLNFRDTLVALGAYPGAPAPFGGECAGIVEEIGSGVEGFAVGDRVVCLAQGCLATHSIVRADLAAKIPDGVRFDVAATVPVAFLTADIGFNRLAGMKRCDRVLIHAATGGVGLAALALAQRIGAEIFATAGSPEKRDYLRHRGVTHVFDSRSLGFADEVLAATNGEGVRIALNSLTGQFVGATLRALAPGGTLLELGKREIWTPQQVAAVRPDISYHVFDAGVMAEADPSLFQQMTRDILPSIVQGTVAPSPIDVYSLDEASDALRRMAQARHIGKIVLTPEPESTQPTVRADGSYLITGGFGGIGLKAAEWLVKNGARHLTLAGRSAPGEGARKVIASLERAGAQIRTSLLDISDHDKMRLLLADIADEAPLRGIIHAAGIAADGLVQNLNASAIHDAQRGKLGGAKILRALTRGMPLDFVVLCSSAAGLFGSQGQGAYAATNAELEVLALQWRREGAPVVSVAWGPWAEGGMFAAASRQAQETWRARGLTPMSDRRAIAALEQVLASGHAHAVAAVIDWPKVFAQAPEGWNGSLFSNFASKAETSFPQPAVSNNELARLRALRGGLQRPALIDVLARRVRIVLDLPEDVPMAAAVPLKQLGLDSLMAVELRNHLARLGGVPLPATLAFDHPTLDALADRLSVVWALDSMPPPDGPDISIANDVDVMSDAEAEAILEAELATLSATSARERRTG